MSYIIIQNNPFLQNVKLLMIHMIFTTAITKIFETKFLMKPCTNPPLYRVKEILNYSDDSFGLERHDVTQILDAGEKMLQDMKTDRVSSMRTKLK